MILSNKDKAVLAALRVARAQYELNAQQYRTLRGQVYAGDTDAALRGLRKIQAARYRLDK